MAAHDELTPGVAELVPDARLRFYEGGHTPAFLDKRFVGDVHRFVHGGN